MKDMSLLWTEDEVKAFLGLRFRKKHMEKKEESPLINGIPEEMPSSVLSLRLDSERIREAIQACASAESGDIVLIIGPGGSGKSAVFRAVAHSVDNALCITPTGIAALNLEKEGWNNDIECKNKEYVVTPPMTINTAFGLGAKDYYRIKDARSGKVENVSHIMVDEVSMVNPNMMDLLIYKAVKMRVPLLLFGDPLQLPPIEDNRVYSVSKYKTWRFFGSFGWMLHKEDKLKCITLDSVYRQNDPKFINLLNRVRMGNINDEDRRILKSRISSQPPSDSLILCFENDQADIYNSFFTGKNIPTLNCNEIYRKIFGHTPFAGMINVEWTEGLNIEDSSNELVVLDKREFNIPDEFECVVDEEIGSEIFHLYQNPNFTQTLKLYPGDRVMITKNTYASYVPDDFAHDLFQFITGEKTDCSFPIAKNKEKNNIFVANGNIGTYLGIANGLTDELKVKKKFKKNKKLDYNKRIAIAQDILDETVSDNLVIKLENGRLILLGKTSFEAKEIDRKGDEKTKERVFQYPLKLAFAITYHKSQGLTHDKIHMVLNRDDPAIPPGLGYLGLSRCRTLKGLTLSEFDEKAFSCDRFSRNFMRRLNLMNTIPDLDQRKALVKLMDIGYEEKEPVYQVTGITARFKSIKKALEISCIPGINNLSPILQRKTSEIDEIDWRYSRYYLKEEKNIESNYSFYTLSLEGKELLWNLNRQKLYLHPELSRLLHLAGEPGRQREMMARRLVEGVEEYSIFSIISFFDLRNPNPGSGDYLRPSEYNENALRQKRKNTAEYKE